MGWQENPALLVGLHLSVRALCGISTGVEGHSRRAWVKTASPLGILALLRGPDIPHEQRLPLLHGQPGTAPGPYRRSTASGRRTSPKYTNGDAYDELGMKPVTLVDARLSYALGALDPELTGLAFALPTTNLFDRRCVASCGSAISCCRGQERQAHRTVSYRW